MKNKINTGRSHVQSMLSYYSENNVKIKMGMTEKLRSLSSNLSFIGDHNNVS
jgi:hypothetical protein